MSHSGTLRFVFDDGRPDENVDFSISDADAAILEAFLTEALILERVLPELALDTLSVGMTARVGGHVEMRAREPSTLQRAALLHHLRPFVLDDEPYSFFKTRNIVANSSAQEFLRNRLKDIKLLFSGKAMQMQFLWRSGDAVINSEATLKRWLNAFEYHRDADKAAALEATLAPLPAGVTRPVFLMLLAQKAYAVLHLAHIVAKMVRPPTASAPEV
jgi:hypothetical protein